MKKYINTSNYYLSTITSKIEVSPNSGTFDVLDVTVDWVTLPEKWYYWVDVDFWDVSKREIFRIKERHWYTLTYDKRISPYWKKEHPIWATVALRDFSELLNSLSTNTDNFWEVEITWDLSVLVRGWNIYLPWNTHAENGKVYIDDKPFTFDTNTTSYIVLEYEYVEWVPAVDFFKKTWEELLETWQYPIAKIVAGNTRIEQSWITDLRANIIGQGNMRSEVYDPDWKKLDVYNYENFYNVPVAEDWDISDISDRANKRWYWNDKQQQLVSWQNIVTINGRSIIDVSQWEWGNIPLDTILTAWWKTYTTINWAETFTFPDEDYYPINEDAFMVFTDSGTILIRGWENPNDYTYDETTHTITFNSPLYEDEHAVVWTMYDASDAALWIGSWVITLQRNWTTITNWQFNVNQEENQTIELWDLASNAQITFTQWWVPDKTITLNQASDDTVALSWIIPISQEDYEDLPDTKLTDNQWYFIIE